MEDKQFEPSYWVIIRNNKKYDGSGNLISYEKIADDDVINDNINEEIDEPDGFFYRLYPWEMRKLEEE